MTLLVLSSSYLTLTWILMWMTSGPCVLRMDWCA